MFQIKTNKKPHLCQAYRCTENKAPKKRFCHKHHARFQKETNPIGYTFNLLHQNAKRRGKEFKLTLGEFKTFCEETNYIELKGKTKKSASIDRIDPRKGYEIGNIQVLSLQANSSKGCNPPDDDVPF
jgi:hypothetical protein